ncbi:MAG TPA: hypothetical protein VF525_16010 [Pyrinomonadaceae bacterium]|jgi:hypothetical protein
MANPPNQQILGLLSEPTVLVNLFEIKNPDADTDRYLYLPCSSFRLPGEHALENVDVDPILYPYEGMDLERGTYVLKGPAFLAWPTTRERLPGSDVRLTEFESAPDVTAAHMGRRLTRVPASGEHYEPRLPGFRAPTYDAEIPGAQPVYEHAATTHRGVKYRYDFIREARDGWSEGQEVFWAVPPEYVGMMLSQAAQEAKSQAPGGGDLTSPESVRQLAEYAVPTLQAGGAVDDRNVENMQRFFTGKGLPVKAFTTSMGGEVSFLFSGMVERGVIWSLQKRKLHGYVTLAGGVGPMAGVSANVSFGVWWGTSEQEVLDNMKGLSYFEVMGGGIDVGLSITLICSKDWQIYGLNISLMAGVEIELGVGAMYTWLYTVSQPRDKFEKIQFPEK